MRERTHQQVGAQTNKVSGRFSHSKQQNYFHATLLCMTCLIRGNGWFAARQWKQPEITMFGVTWSEQWRAEAGEEAELPLCRSAAAISRQLESSTGPLPGTRLKQTQHTPLIPSPSSPVFTEKRHPRAQKRETQQMGCSDTGESWISPCKICL